MKRDLGAGSCGALLAIWMLLWFAASTECALNTSHLSPSSRGHGEQSSLPSGRDFSLTLPVLPEPIQVPSFEDPLADEAAATLAGRPSSSNLQGSSAPTGTSTEAAKSRTEGSSPTPGATVPSARKVNVWVGVRSGHKSEQEAAAETTSTPPEQSKDKSTSPLVIRLLSPPIRAIRKLDFGSLPSEVKQGLSLTSPFSGSVPKKDSSDPECKRSTQSNRPASTSATPPSVWKKPSSLLRSRSHRDFSATGKQQHTRTRSEAPRRHIQDKDGMLAKAKPRSSATHTAAAPAKGRRGKPKKLESSQLIKSRAAIASDTAAVLKPEAPKEVAGKQQDASNTTPRKGKALKSTKKTSDKAVSTARHSRAPKAVPPPHPPAKRRDKKPIIAEPKVRGIRQLVSTLPQASSDSSISLDSVSQSAASEPSQSSSDSEASSQMPESPQQTAKPAILPRAAHKDPLKSGPSGKGKPDLSVYHRKAREGLLRSSTIASKATRARSILPLYPIPKSTKSAIVPINPSPSSDQRSKQRSVAGPKEPRLYARWVGQFPRSAFLDSSISWKSMDSSSSSEQSFYVDSPTADTGRTYKGEPFYPTGSPPRSYTDGHSSLPLVLSMGGSLASNVLANAGKASAHDSSRHVERQQ